MMGHDLVWTQPPALLTSGGSRLLPAGHNAVPQPVILRFHHDAFMQEFMTVLETKPEQLRDYEVRRETWRGFVPGPTVATPKPDSIVRRRLGLIGRGTQPMASPNAPAAAVPALPAGTPLKLY